MPNMCSICVQVRLIMQDTLRSLAEVSVAKFVAFMQVGEVVRLIRCAACCTDAWSAWQGRLSCNSS